MATEYELKKSLPNKMVNENNTITDLAGNAVTNAVTEYENKPALPNKWLNPDGTYSTLADILSGMIDTDLFIVVEELPASGNVNKIYLLADGDTLKEYHWTGTKWDPIGMVEFDLSKYSTTEQMNEAIMAALNSAKTYTDEQIAGIKEKSQIFYWDGNTQQAGIDFWNTVVNATKDTQVIVYNNVSNSNSRYSSYVYFKKGQFTNQMTQYKFSFTPHSLDVSDKVSYTQHVEWKTVVQLTLNNTTVTNVGKWTYNDTIDYLRIDYDYSTPYVPQYPGSPATKKYVDDSIATNITNVLGGSY